ncbi:MAG: shikimate kinase [Deltaproteobacteria bacterium]|nr:shikimate kinase [Deltaproteobacteria bacterium]
MTDTKNIYLTGFMACGKSRAGRYLSERMGRELIDTDAKIEERAQKSIAQIFADDGEQAFRDLEHNLIKELSQQDRLIVSLGGGAAIFERNQKILNTGHWIFFETPFETIWTRLQRKSHRPLAKAPKEEVEQLYLKRLPEYQKAKWTISLQDQETHQACDEIIARILSL